MSAILNQPWEDVADDVPSAIEKAVQPLLKKATDAVYAGLLDTTQDYLRDNMAFNIASRIDAAERQAYSDRVALELERARSAEMSCALQQAQAQLAKAADQFAFYADEHAKKGTADGDAKGATNHQWALACAKADYTARAALAKALGDAS